MDTHDRYLVYEHDRYLVYELAVLLL